MPVAERDDDPMPRLAEVPGWVLQQLPQRLRVAVMAMTVAAAVAAVLVTVLVVLPAA